jgi:hypothetical protein
MCPKVKKSIEETKEENKISSQSKAINHMIQGQQSSYTQFNLDTLKQ